MTGALTQRRGAGRRQRLRRIGKAGAAITVAAALGNALAYVVPVLGARQLAPGTFSALATVMSICAIGSVPGLGLQTAVAVHRARGDAGRGIGRLTLTAVSATAVVLVTLTPLLSRALDLPWTAIAWATALTIPVVAAGRYLGELQGSLRFARLAVAMLLLAVARTTGVILGLAFGAGLVGSLAAGAGVAWLSLGAIRLIRPAADHPSNSEASTARLTRDLIAASSATLAMFLISNADLIAARYLLTPVAAGGYAVLSVLTKGALWAPQVITVLALPRFARGVRRTRSIAALAVLLIGGALVAAAAAAGPLAVRLAGGGRYEHLAGYAPAFAATGALYALVFVLVNAQVAAGRTAPAAPLWLAMAGFTAVVLALPRPTIGSVVTIALGAAATATVLVSAVTLWQRRPPVGAANV